MANGCTRASSSSKTSRRLPPRFMLTPRYGSIVTQQRTFGYTNEELRLLVAPMARTGAEPIGSMGTDAPIAVLSARPRLL
jgi:glutamate synthase (NADPH) large chain